MRRDQTITPGSNRVPGHLVILLLAVEGIVIRPGTLRSLSSRGVISRNSDGYDLADVERYRSTRASRALLDRGRNNMQHFARRAVPNGVYGEDGSR